MTQAPSIEKTQLFLSFQLPPQIQAMLPIKQLLEVLTLAPHQIVPIPDVPTYVMGVCNWRGEVLWLADLGYLLGAMPLSRQTYLPSNYSVIIVQHQTHILGLVVEQISQMIRCYPTQIQPIPILQQQPLERSPYLQGYWLSPQGETLLVLDSETLIDSLATNPS
jgi:positive phototaxis protein PixI